MSKEVTVEELRERLDEIIAEVEAGESVTIVREKTPEGGPKISQKGKRFPFRDIVITPLKRPIEIDAVDLIRQDRDDEFPAVIAYLDASVLLRKVLNQHPQLEEWSALDAGVSSALVAVECNRSLERLWRTGRLPDEEITPKREEATAIVRRLELLPITQAVLDLASMPMPVPLRTLDAIHLATALAYRRAQQGDERSVLFATHDRQLAEAAAALHFEVIGIAA